MCTVTLTCVHSSTLWLPLEHPNGPHERAKLERERVPTDHLMASSERAHLSLRQALWWPLRCTLVTWEVRSGKASPVSKTTLRSARDHAKPLTPLQGLASLLVPVLWEGTCSLVPEGMARDLTSIPRQV